MDEDAQKQAKTDWRTAKSAFTRVGKSLVHTVKHERPPIEVRQALTKLQVVYDTLVCKHVGYAALIGKMMKHMRKKRSGLPIASTYVWN